MSISSKDSIEKAIKRYQEAIIPDLCLAQIVQVIDIRPILGADLIESCKVLGWWVVSRKGDFKVGDLVIYVKIGAVLDPTVSHFSFLEGKPLKTKKIRGSMSQGLLGSLSWLSNGSLEEGQDITTALEVRKFVESENKGVYSQNNGLIPKPDFIPKTDEERVQNFNEKHWTLFKGQQVRITRKEDGCSATYYYISNRVSGSLENKFAMITRNYEIETANKSVAHYILIDQKFGLEKKMTALGRSIAIQGEIVGPIQHNRLQLKDWDYRVFNVWDIEQQLYLSPQEVDEICVKLDLNQVPIVSTVVIDDTMLCAEFWLEWADRVEYEKGFPAEGIVVKSCGSDHMSFKAISNAYLLKHNV